MAYKHLATWQIRIKIAWPTTCIDFTGETVCGLSQRQIGMVQKVLTKTEQGTIRFINEGMKTCFKGLILCRRAFNLAHAHLMFVDVRVFLAQSHIVWKELRTSIY